MSQQTNPSQEDEDDYDVIIEGAGIGDPVTVFGLSFKGKKAPTAEAPLSEVVVGVSLFWENSNRRIDVGQVNINKISTPGPYLYAIPYDDKLFGMEVNQGIPTVIYLSVSAKDSLGHEVRFGNAQPIGNGKYVISSDEITPKYFDTINNILDQYK